MRKRRDAPRGTLHPLTIDSTVLRSNRLGDPTERELPIYLPAGQDGAGLPLLVALAAFTGGGPALAAWRNFGENVPERLDRLITEQAMPPVAVAFLDCFTRLGGNQYINSVVTGRWEDFLIDEMLPAVEGRFGCGGTGRRGLFGTSSGGYGALVQAMRRPEVWAAAACHSGDIGFELCYLPDMPQTLRVLAGHELSVERFLRAFEAAHKHDPKDVHCLMVLAMAASYDPDPDPHRYFGIRLPVDLETCELIEARWAHWLAWDPLRLIETHADALRRLKGLFFDCGTADQYNLLYGARRLHRALHRLDIAHHYEEFNDNHSSIDYRLDVSLPWLARALAG